MKKFLYLISIVMIVSCGTKNKPIVKDNFTAEELFENGNNALSKKEYGKAIENFSKVTQEHPYSNMASKAQMMEAYSYYLKHDYDMAVNVTDDFIKLYPSNVYTSYMYYLKALSYYEQIQDIEHDHKITENTKEAALNLISHFPESSYARDFKIKLDLINDHLAGKEMNIGRFYLHRGEILSAMKRFTNVVENYQTTSHIEEALYRLVEGYLKLGIIEEANKYASILGYNYPNGKWYGYAYKFFVKDKKDARKSSD